MGFTDAVRSGFSNYVTFSGRARRSEFWFWVLFVIIVNAVALGIDGMLFPGLASGQITDAGASFAVNGGPVSWIASLALLLPGLAMTVRRLHDTDGTGWWILIGLTGIGIIVLIVWYCTEGTRGPNRFGPDPKA